MSIKPRSNQCIPSLGVIWGSPEGSIWSYCYKCGMEPQISVFLHFEIVSCNFSCSDLCHFLKFEISKYFLKNKRSTFLLLTVTCNFSCSDFRTLAHTWIGSHAKFCMWAKSLMPEWLTLNDSVKHKNCLFHYSKMLSKHQLWKKP